MTLRLKGRTLLPVLLAAAAAAFGFSAAQANAQPGVNTTLTITPASWGFSTVQVSGYAAMSRADAQAIVAGGRRTSAQWSLYGADSIYDDFLDGPNLATLRASSRGLEYNATRVLATSKLNEDWGEDEVFATIKIYSEKGIKFGSSNQIHRSF
jgi:hypothetical protein